LKSSLFIVGLLSSLQMLAPFDCLAASSGSRSRDLRPADYCTVFFAPKLGEKLNLNVVQRVVAAMQVETAMDDAGGARAARIRQNNLRMGFDMPNTFQEVTEDSILRDLDRSGKVMRDALTPAQIAEFEKMFKAGEIGPVGADMGPTPGMFVVRYTHYGEKKQDSPSSAKAIRHQGDMRMIATIKNLDEALEVLCSPNKMVNLYGLEWLQLNAKVPNNADRARVLAALQESLDFAIRAPYQKLNIDCIALFCAWSDKTQIKRLQQVCLVRGKADEARALAVSTLIKLDPEAAERLISEHARESSFRTDMKRTLEGLKKSSEVPAEAVAKLSSLIEKAETEPSKPAPVSVVSPAKPKAEKPAEQAPKKPDPKPSPPAVEKPSKPPVDISAIIAGIQSGENSQVVRNLMNAARLTEADKELASAVLKVLKESPTVTHRIHAAKALEKWGQPDALPALEQATKDKNNMLKGQAQRAITAINARQGK